jgi:hypothetical protein
MNRRQAIGVLGLPLLLGACLGNRASFRYKLTLAVDTPEGVKSGFSVVEVAAWDVSVPDRGTMSRAIGEAVYVDLGAGMRPVVAAMIPYRPKQTGLRWSDGKPNARQLLELYGERVSGLAELIDDIRRLARHRGARALTPNDLPYLVTFADINVPASALAIDPYNLPAALGQDVKWNSLTIEVTNDSVTTGIDKRLPWLMSLRTTLNGKALRPFEDELNPGHLVASNFKRLSDIHR